MKRWFLLCLIVLNCEPLLAQEAADDPWMLMEKAAQAAHQLSYKGIFVSQSGKNVSSIQLEHVNFGQGEYARMVRLDGSPREVFRKGDEVVIYNPRNEKVTIERRRTQSAFPAVVPLPSANVKTYYQLKPDGQERVGGRDATVLRLDARDHLRYSYKFYVDREFGLLLKFVMFNEKGEPLEQIAFNQLSLMDTGNLDWYKPNLDHAKTYVMEPEETVTPVSVEGGEWTITQLPVGFYKIDQFMRNVPGKLAPVHQIVFSDGLAAVSLFIEPLDKSVVVKVGHFGQGPTNVMANSMNGYQVVVVGETPEVTVNQIFSAVKFTKK